MSLNQMMFSSSVRAAYSNAACSEIFLREFLSVDLPSLMDLPIKGRFIFCLGSKRRFEVILGPRVIVGVSRNGPFFVVSVDQVLVLSPKMGN